MRLTGCREYGWGLVGCNRVWDGLRGEAKVEGEAIGMTLERVAQRCIRWARRYYGVDLQRLSGYGVQSAAAAWKNERAPNKVPCTGPLSIEFNRLVSWSFTDVVSLTWRDWMRDKAALNYSGLKINVFASRPGRKSSFCYS